MNQDLVVKPNEQAQAERTTAQVKIYRKPRLEKLGDLRTLTLGVSGAPVDFSGGGINQRTPP